MRSIREFKETLSEGVIRPFFILSFSALAVTLIENDYQYRLIFILVFATLAIFAALRLDYSIAWWFSVSIGALTVFSCSVAIYLSGGVSSPTFWVVLFAVFAPINIRQFYGAAAYTAFGIAASIHAIVNATGFPLFSLGGIITFVITTRALGQVRFRVGLWALSPNSRELGYANIDEFVERLLAKTILTTRADRAIFCGEPETGDVIDSLTIIARAGRLDTGDLGKVGALWAIPEWVSDRLIRMRKRRRGVEGQGPRIFRNRSILNWSSEIAIPIRRGRKGDVVGLIYLQSNRPFVFWSAVDLRLLTLIGEAELVYNLLIQNRCYREVVATSYPDLRIEGATRGKVFEEQLETICEVLVPKSAGQISLDLSIETAEIPSPSNAGSLPAVEVKHTLDEPNRAHTRCLVARLSVENQTEEAFRITRSFLQDVIGEAIGGNFIRIHEAREASNRDLIGLANLEPRVPSDLTNEGAIKPGFKILWVNNQMGRWLPQAPNSLGGICFKVYNSENQDTACPGCPVYEEQSSSNYWSVKHDDDSAKVMPAHSPAGSKRVYRHFELATTTIRDPFSGLPSFIRETVTDHTLENEFLGLVHKTTQLLRKTVFFESLPDERRSGECSPFRWSVYEMLAESLGRNFQADQVVILTSQPNGKGWDIEGMFRRKYIGDENGHNNFLESERRELDKIYNESSDLLKYFESRDPLFESKKNFPDSVDDAGDPWIGSAHLKSAYSGTAVEYRAEVSEPLLNANGGGKMIVAGMKELGVAVVVNIDTGEEEPPEKTSTLQLSQCMVSVVETLLYHSELAAEAARASVFRFVKELGHELNHIFMQGELYGNQLRMFFKSRERDGSLHSKLISQLLEGRSLDWESISMEEFDIWLSGVGADDIDPNDKAKCIEGFRNPIEVLGLREMSADRPKLERVLRIGQQSVLVASAVSGIQDGAKRGDELFDLLLGKTEEGTILVAKTLASICLRECDGKLDQRIRINAASDLECELPSSVFDLIISNFIRNGLQHSEGDIDVEAQYDSNVLRVSVTTEGKIREELIDGMFHEALPRLESSGNGLGLSIVGRIARQHSVDVACELGETSGSTVFSATFKS